MQTTDDVVRQFGAAVRAQEASEAKMKGATMPKQPTIPAHVEKAYTLLDICDVLAAQPGGAPLADAHVQKLIGLTVKAFPRAAGQALREADPQMQFIAYKAAGEVSDTDLIDQTRAALGPEAFRAALQQLLDAATAPPVKPSATVTEKTEKDAATWSLGAACNGTLVPDDWRFSK